MIDERSLGISLSLLFHAEIMTSQELDQHSKIPTTKAKGYIL